MAKSFLSKFNTLIQANLRSAIGGRRIKDWRAGDDPNEEIARLREQLQAAEQNQLAVDRRIAALNDEILQWDARIDEFLRAGREADARHAIEQMEGAKRRATMMQSERDDHQRAMSEFLRQLNQLEALVDSAARQAASDAPEASNTAQQTLSEAIRQAREAAPQSPEKSLQIPVEIEDDGEAVEQELAARRARLAKPD